MPEYLASDFGIPWRVKEFICKFYEPSIAGKVEKNHDIARKK